jgi:hypothetical protein
MAALRCLSLNLFKHDSKRCEREMAQTEAGKYDAGDS